MNKFAEDQIALLREEFILWKRDAGVDMPFNSINLSGRMTPEEYMGGVAAGLASILRKIREREVDFRPVMGLDL